MVIAKMVSLKSIDWLIVNLGRARTAREEHVSGLETIKQSNASQRLDRTEREKNERIGTIVNQIIIIIMKSGGGERTNEIERNTICKKRVN